MCLGDKISIDGIRGIQEDEKTKRTIILAENGGHEIELSITAKQLGRLMGLLTVRSFEAAVAKMKSTRSLSKRTA